MQTELIFIATREWPIICSSIQMFTVTQFVLTVLFNLLYNSFFSDLNKNVHTDQLSKTRDYEVREHIPHTWVSSNDSFSQSNFSAWSHCAAILRKTPDWSVVMT